MIGQMAPYKATWYNPSNGAGSVKTVPRGLRRRRQGAPIPRFRPATARDGGQTESALPARELHPGSTGRSAGYAFNRAADGQDVTGGSTIELRDGGSAGALFDAVVLLDHEVSLAPGATRENGRSTPGKPRIPEPYRTLFSVDPGGLPAAPFGRHPGDRGPGGRSPTRSTSSRHGRRLRRQRRGRAPEGARTDPPPWSRRRSRGRTTDGGDPGEIEAALFAALARINPSGGGDGHERDGPRCRVTRIARRAREPLRTSAMLGPLPRLAQQARGQAATPAILLGFDGEAIDPAADTPSRPSPARRRRQGATWTVLCAPRDTRATAVVMQGAAGECGGLRGDHEPPSARRGRAQQTSAWGPLPRDERNEPTRAHTFVLGEALRSRRALHDPASSLDARRGRDGMRSTTAGASPTWAWTRKANLYPPGLAEDQTANPLPGFRGATGYPCRRHPGAADDGPPVVLRRARQRRERPPGDPSSLRTAPGRAVGPGLVRAPLAQPDPEAQPSAAGRLRRGTRRRRWTSRRETCSTATMGRSRQQTPGPSP